MNTSAPRDLWWYRQEAARLHQKAATVNDSAELRDSYLALAIEYERLAVILEKSTLARASRQCKKDRVH